MRFIRTLWGSSPLLLAILQTTQSAAMPALDTPVRLQQPDGQVFEALPVGDEWNNRMETPPGFTIARDASGTGRFRYGIRAVNDSTPSATWTYSNTVEITDSGGGGSGGGVNPKPCRGKNCSS